MDMVARTLCAVPAASDAQLGQLRYDFASPDTVASPGKVGQAQILNL
jgi:hypothetical protein